MDANTDQVADAVDDPEITIAVHLGQVAGVEPAIAQRLLGLFGPAPVALHHLRSADHQLADWPGLSSRPLRGCTMRASVPGRGMPMAAHLALAKEGVGVGHRAGLGQAIALHQPPLGQLLKTLLHFDGQRAGPADAGLDAGDLIVAHVGELVDGRVHRRHTGEQGGMMAADGLQDRLGIEASEAAPPPNR